MSLYTEIFVTFSFEGEHCYPDAPDEVSYLRNVHRHLFNVRVEMFELTLMWSMTNARLSFTCSNMNYNLGFDHMKIALTNLARRWRVNWLDTCLPIITVEISL